MDTGAWRATVHGVAESQTPLGSEAQHILPPTPTSHPSWHITLSRVHCILITKKKNLKETAGGNSLAVLWLELWSFTAKDSGLIAGN